MYNGIYITSGPNDLLWLFFLRTLLLFVSSPSSINTFFPFFDLLLCRMVEYKINFNHSLLILPLNLEIFCIDLISPFPRFALMASSICRWDPLILSAKLIGNISFSLMVSYLMFVVVMIEFVPIDDWFLAVVDLFCTSSLSVIWSFF